MWLETREPIASATFSDPATHVRNGFFLFTTFHCHAKWTQIQHTADTHGVLTCLHQDHAASTYLHYRASLVKPHIIHQGTLILKSITTCRTPEVAAPKLLSEVAVRSCSPKLQFRSCSPGCCWAPRDAAGAPRGVAFLGAFLHDQPANQLANQATGRTILQYASKAFPYAFSYYLYITRISLAYYS